MRYLIISVVIVLSMNVKVTSHDGVVDRYGCHFDSQGIEHCH